MCVCVWVEMVVRCEARGGCAAAACKAAEPPTWRSAEKGCCSHHWKVGNQDSSTRTKSRRR